MTRWLPWPRIQYHHFPVQWLNMPWWMASPELRHLFHGHESTWCWWQQRKRGCPDPALYPSEGIPHEDYVGQGRVIVQNSFSICKTSSLLCISSVQWPEYTYLVTYNASMSIIYVSLLYNEHITISPYGYDICTPHNIYCYDYNWPHQQNLQVPGLNNWLILMHSCWLPCLWDYITLIISWWPPILWDYLEDHPFSWDYLSLTSSLFLHFSSDF